MGPVQGSNKANEKLRAKVIDIGSTAGTPALRAGPTDRRSGRRRLQPAGVVGHCRHEELAHHASRAAARAKVAATQGTDPYFFLLQGARDRA